ncbi:hypothetical protein AB0H23_27135, partial [Streptomyces albogriseolus]
MTPTSGFSQSPDRRKQAAERSAEANSSQREELHSVYPRNARGLHFNFRAQHGSSLGACALTANEDGTADIFTGGRKLRVNVSPNV